MARLFLAERKSVDRLETIVLITDIQNSKIINKFRFI